MELLFPIKFITARDLSRACTCLKVSWNRDHFGRIRFQRKFRHFAFDNNAVYNSASAGSIDRDFEADCTDFWSETDFIDVIGIGSRKDALLDYCMESLPSSSNVRFWSIHVGDFLGVQLTQRSHGKDILLRNVTGAPSSGLRHRAIILMATAGYGPEYKGAIKVLGDAQLTDGLAVAIVLTPFSFEGQKRRSEVEDLVHKLKEYTHFCIVVDTDSLLEQEVTLSEALQSANNAVFLAIKSISHLVSGTHLKVFYSLNEGEKEVDAQEVTRLLKIHREAKIGFGAGKSMESSITQAVFNCPFFSENMKEFNGMVICTFSSANILVKHELHECLHIFRQTTEFPGEILFSSIHDIGLGDNLVVTTYVLIGYSGIEESTKKNNFLSSIALHFPFVFSFLGRKGPQLADRGSSDSNRSSYPFEALSSEDVDKEIQYNDSYNQFYDFRNSITVDNGNKIGGSEGTHDHEYNLYSSLSINEETTFDREGFGGWNVGPTLRLAQELARKRSIISGPAKIHESKGYTLPVGVRLSDEMKNASQSPNASSLMDNEVLNNRSVESLGNQQVPSLDTLTGAGFDTVMDIYNAASSFFKGNTIPSGRRGLLSSRAESMLEAERDSQKKLTPIVEMEYRGGTYKGRCQGGLPEGKGRLTFIDGSFYDGMWRNGKRYGLGTFYHSNGDMYQGSWRDDLMHGKGWFYFHTGDRWFANFWKGKANGEGRFYSTLGSVFFGWFRNGWRHGQSIYIEVDGTRWAEVWDDGLLVSRKFLDEQNNDTAHS